MNEEKIGLFLLQTERSYGNLKMDKLPHCRNSYKTPVDKMMQKGKIDTPNTHTWPDNTSLVYNLCLIHLSWIFMTIKYV